MTSLGYKNPSFPGGRHGDVSLKGIAVQSLSAMEETSRVWSLNGKMTAAGEVACEENIANAQGLDALKAAEQVSIHDEDAG